MGLPVFHIKGGHHVVALKPGEVVDKAVQAVFAEPVTSTRNKSCRFYLLQYTSQAPGIRSGSGWVLNSALFSA